MSRRNSWSSTRPVEVVHLLRCTQDVGQCSGLTLEFIDGFFEPRFQRFAWNAAGDHLKCGRSFELKHDWPSRHASRNKHLAQHLGCQYSRPCLPLVERARRTGACGIGHGRNDRGERRVVAAQLIG